MSCFPPDRRARTRSEVLKFLLSCKFTPSDSHVKVLAEIAPTYIGPHPLRKKGDKGYAAKSEEYCRRVLERPGTIRLTGGCRRRDPCRLAAWHRLVRSDDWLAGRRPGSVASFGSTGCPVIG